MTDTNISENIKNCSKESFDAFIGMLESDKSLKRTAFRPADEKVPYIRYRYLCDKARVMLTYNTEAKILSITSQKEYVQRFRDIYSGSVMQPATQTQSKPDLSKQDKQKKPLPAKKINKDKQTDKPVKPTQPNQKPSQQAQKPNQKPSQQEQKPNQKPSQQAQRAAQKKSQKDEAAAVEYKDGLYLKNYTQEALDLVIKIIKGTKGIVIRQEAATIKGAGDVKVYKIEDAQKQRLYLRYFAKKQALQLQGKKQSSLNIELVPLIVKHIDYKAAVNSYIAQSGDADNASAVEKRLKKLMPAAFNYLTEQSKKYFTFALIDISNEENKLSDYSVLLSSPYKGLERLIYDLQTAENIVVKMIGQAYERNDKGEYTLKVGYRRKIPSVIYNEVMSSLYQEYFEKRNFYMHSDNSENFEMRSISNKDEVKKIFDNLLRIVNYNCQKLSEIGFTIDKNKR